MPDPYKLDEMRQSMENQMKSITESLEWRKEEFEARINSYLAYQNKLNGTEQAKVCIRLPKPINKYNQIK